MGVKLSHHEAKQTLGILYPVAIRITAQTHTSSNSPPPTTARLRTQSVDPQQPNPLRIYSTAAPAAPVAVVALQLARIVSRFPIPIRPPQVTSIII